MMSSAPGSSSISPRPGAVPGLTASLPGAGVRMCIKCLALEFASHAITVNAVAPGPIDTPMLGPNRDDRMR